MNPYREHTSEWHAYEQGFIAGRAGMMPNLNEIFGKMGAQQTGEFVRRNAVPVPRRVPGFVPGSVSEKIVTYLRDKGPTSRKVLMKLARGSSVETKLAKLLLQKVIYRPKYGVYALHSDYLVPTTGKKS